MHNPPMKPKIANAQVPAIIEAYNNGESAYRIGLRHGCKTEMPVLRVLQQAGVARRPVRKYTCEQMQLVARLYQEGHSVRQIAAQTHLQIDKASFYNMLKRCGIQRRTPTECHSTCEINAHAFDNLDDEDVAYWIGLLLADGGIVRNSVVLSLSYPDMDHVLTFRAFLRSTHAILYKTQPNGRPLARFTGVSAPLIERLNTLGVTPRKSLTATAPPQLVHNRHFWRGVIDGDGSIYLNRQQSRAYPNLGLTGSKPLLHQYATFVRRVCPTWKGEPHQRSYSSVYDIRLGGTSATVVLKCLYTECNTALERKHRLAMSMLDYRSSWLSLTGDPTYPLRSAYQ
jgi:hypothetical protein